MNHIRSPGLKKLNIVRHQGIPQWVRTVSAKVNDLWWPSIYQDKMPIRSDVVLFWQSRMVSSIQSMATVKLHKSRFRWTIGRLQQTIGRNKRVALSYDLDGFRLEKSTIWVQGHKVKPKFRNAFKSEWYHVWIQNRMFLIWDMSWFESFRDFELFESWVKLIQTLRQPLESWSESMQDFGMVS